MRMEFWSGNVSYLNDFLDDFLDDFLNIFFDLFRQHIYSHRRESGLFLSQDGKAEELPVAAQGVG